MKFTDLPCNVRMNFREAIEAAGGSSIDYIPDGRIQVALTNKRPVSETIRMIESLGFAAGSGHYFPLGSDAAPEDLRHFGPGSAVAPRGDRPSYWLYWTFSLKFHPEIEQEVNLQELGGR